MDAISQVSNQSSVASASLSLSSSSSVALSSRPQTQTAIISAPKISEATMNEQAVKGAIKQANQSLQSQSAGSSVSFGYEAKLGQMFVQIHDGKTGSVIGEFPSKSARSLQIAMNEMVGLLLDRKG